MTTKELRYLTAQVLAVDFGDALPLIEAAMPTLDPVEVYWDIIERAEMDAELAEDF
jgi:hypothetical protein